MRKYWNFPATVGGNVNSINNAGLETFRGNALESLTREICQNSLDAVKNSNEPVLVEFKEFKIDINELPQKDELVNAFKHCQTTWQGKNEKSEEFIQQALSILNKDTMNVLRISDFNTRGLEGADTAELGSPWSSLIKEAGSSNKGDSSGGSFGIGKSAPFLNSKLRTLFYSSLDITGYESHIGVANIMSFQLPGNKTTTGYGYYTNNENSTAIPGQFYLDRNFKRVESGTDIFVTAFEPKDNWEDEVIKAVLYSFFITILNNKLIVKVNDFIINKENIVDLIESLDDHKDNRILKQYCKVFTSNETIKIPYPEKTYRNGVQFEEGEAHLYLMNGDDLNRRVLMTRKTGMRIFEQGHISGSISFTGLFIISGKNMNNIFKQMENPEHNKWEPKRYEEDEKLADTIYADVRKFIRNQVREHFQEKITDEMDAVGLSDFLPNKNLLGEGENNKAESLTTKVKSIGKKKIDQKRVKKTKVQKGKDLEEIEEQLEGEFGISSGDEGGPGTSKNTEGDGIGAGTGAFDGQNEISDDVEGSLNKKKNKKATNRPIPMNHRYICINKEKGRYRLNVTPEKDLLSGRLEFRVIGEQSVFELPIKGAHTIDNNVVVEKISDNTVYLNSIQKNRTFMLDVDINYSDYCVMEVILYEN